MIKNVKWFFVVLVFSSLISLSFSKESVPTEKLTSGDKLPELRLCEDMQSLNMHAPSNGFLLLSFWASYDAQSRMQNVSLSNVLRSASRNDNVEMVSVSFDEYQSIFKETVRKDQIVTPTCFVETKGESSGLFKKYRLGRGFTNYLLDENGVIIAKNISAAELSAYLN